MWETLYIALPAAVANMLPVLAAKWNTVPIVDSPVNETWFGSHKTWRGIIVGTLGGCVTALVQFFIYAPHLENIVHAFFFGFLMGSGALFGDLAKSFIKRRLGIESGRPFIPFDQIDAILGALLFTSLLYAWTAQQVLVLVIAALVVSPIANIAAYSLGIKKTYW